MSKQLKGFTLVEVLIAVVILALVIGAAAMAESLNIRTGGTNKRQLEALGLAQQGLNLSKSIGDNDKLNKTTIFPTPTVTTYYQLNPSSTTPQFITPTSSTGACADKSGEVIQLNGIDYCREIQISP